MVDNFQRYSLFISAILMLTDPLPGLTPQDAETNWRWIGIKTQPEAVCPTLGSWQAEPLFDQGDNSVIPPGLERFCLYESAPVDTTVNLRDLVAQGLLSAVEPDHMAVAGRADELTAALWQPLRDHFLAQAGGVDLPVCGITMPRLTVVDTGATNYTDPENDLGASPHGYTLVNMARDLLCGDTGCVAQVASRLAMACVGFDKDHKEPGCRKASGGFIGTISDLAGALRKEVYNWQTTASSQRLILNLSLGWDPAFGGTATTTAPPDVQAVHAALEDAVCRGALVIAAAGNTGGGPGPEAGPLYPAAWEQLPAPDLAACRALIHEVPADVYPRAGTSAYRPLVYAVGGVGGDDEPLTNTRPEATPRLVAFADHAVADDATATGPTAMLTGTSVSALVASAAAAAVWHYEPGLKPLEVMESVYQAGVDLGRPAEFCLGGSAPAPCPSPAPSVRRASVCAAVDFACAAQGCCAGAASPACPTGPGAELDLSGIDLSTFLATADPIDLDDVDQLYDPNPECSGETLLYDAAYTPGYPCPHQQLYGVEAEPWTEPQPLSDPCSACWMETSLADDTSILYVEVDSSFQGNLAEPTLIIGTDTYNLGLPAGLAAGDQLEVSNVPDPAGLPVALSFKVDDTILSVTSPVLTTDN